MRARAIQFGQNNLQAFDLQDMLLSCEHAWRTRTGDITNYLSLMDQLRRASGSHGPVILVTFNYDRLLDRALHHFDIEIKSIDDYIKNDRVKLFKLHGLINWGRKINSLTLPDIGLKNPHEIAHHIMDKSPELKLSANYVFDDEHFPFVRYNGVPVYPALAIPIINATFECPAAHVDKLRQVIKDTKKS